MRIQEGMSEEPDSTEVGTNIRSSVKNLAQFKNRKTSATPSKKNLLAASRAGGGVFESNFDAYTSA